MLWLGKPAIIGEPDQESEFPGFFLELGDANEDNTLIPEDYEYAVDDGNDLAMMCVPEDKVEDLLKYL